MRRRLDALIRIGRLQTLMHDVRRVQLNALDRMQAELNDDLRVVFDALEAEGLAYGAQAGLAARRIRVLQLKLDQLAREQESARRGALVQGTRAKLAELAIEAAALANRRSSERKELAEIIERALARGASWT
ncbi:MAG: hypothetical protein JO136_13245 [Hyphomicrobiales bacterium]|nr:hypothetical protein [Hyphomicrobiales bacterium]